MGKDERVLLLDFGDKNVNMTLGIHQRQHAALLIV